ncbi:hypothetical protein L1987_24521 [Smallanthus sonchifolius]|uniref:Uncharacterized protein n=1 Tax=Smallanthus sonchifolius TaxID=185202 RepID=A0ACB9IKG3_9ASTR|nr:hypothetical protein L1987_24521 [Smallanthus sonchifolius]
MGTNLYRQVAGLEQSIARHTESFKQELARNAKKELALKHAEDEVARLYNQLKDATDKLASVEKEIDRYQLELGQLARAYIETCNYTTSSLNLGIVGDSERRTVEAKVRPSVEKELARITPLVESALLTAQKVRDRCGYGWVKLNDLFATI